MHDSKISQFYFFKCYTRHVNTKSFVSFFLVQVSTMSKYMFKYLFIRLDF